MLFEIQNNMNNMADGRRNHGQLPKSLNPTRSQRNNDENGSATGDNGDVPLPDRCNQGQHIHEQFPSEQETVLSVVSLISMGRRAGGGIGVRCVFHTKLRTNNGQKNVVALF